MSEAYIGEIRAYGFNFAPYNWMLCNGQLLPIAQYTALFSIIGTYYGGNGTTNFALPNLQGQIPMHWGTGPTTTVIGETQGQPNVTLTISQLPSHSHIATAALGSGTEETNTPSAATYLGRSSPSAAYQSAPTLGPQFAPSAISLSGSSLPHENMQPYLTLNFCICFNGYFPTRS